MFALLLPAGAAIVVGVKKKIDAHHKFQKAKQKHDEAIRLRGCAAGALRDDELELWRERAAVATQRITGLERTLEARAHPHAVFKLGHAVLSG